MSQAITVRYFASIREAMGRGSETVLTQARSVGQLRDELIARDAAAAQALAEGRAVRMALNQSLCEAGAEIKAGDEVAFFPPVTGG